MKQLYKISGRSSKTKIVYFCEQVKIVAAAHKECRSRFCCRTGILLKIFSTKVF